LSGASGVSRGSTTRRAKALRGASGGDQGVIMGKRSHRLLRTILLALAAAAMLAVIAGLVSSRATAASP
jgi:hypothetical protein